MPIDYRKYPPDWKQKRDAVLARADNRCEFENCGRKNGQIVYSVLKKSGEREWYDEKLVAYSNSLEQWSDRELAKQKIKEVKVVLTTAHLDHDEDNADVKLDRLMAMCQVHHLRYDKEEKQKRRSIKNEIQH